MCVSEREIERVKMLVSLSMQFTFYILAGKRAISRQS